MAIKLTAKQFFTEKLDTSIEGLRNIDKTYLNEGEAAAEKQFAAYLKKGGLDTARFFSKSEAIFTVVYANRNARIYVYFTLGECIHHANTLF